MTGLYASFDLAEVLRLIPEAGTLPPEALQERLADIRSRYTVEQITAFLIAGTPLPPLATGRVQRRSTNRVHPTRARA